MTEPEPMAAEPGDAAPIFESVRSGYLYAFGRGMPQGSEQPADATPAGRPAEPAASSDHGTGRALAWPPTARRPVTSGRPQRVPQPGQVRGTAADQETRHP